MSQSFNDHDFSLRKLKRFLVEWLFGGESGPEFPWESETAGPLAFDAGCLWGAGAKRTLGWNWQPYELGTGIPNGADGLPALMYAARQKFYGAVTAGPAVAFDHEFATWPLVQCIQRGGGAGGVPWLMFDPLAAGGSVLFDISLDQITVDFGGAFDGIVVIVG